LGRIPIWKGKQSWFELFGDSLDTQEFCQGSRLSTRWFLNSNHLCYNKDFCKKELEKQITITDAID